jgi:hypothetical protein
MERIAQASDAKYDGWKVTPTAGEDREHARTEDRSLWQHR